MKKMLTLLSLSALLGTFGTACNDIGGQEPGQQQVTDVPFTEYPSPQMIADEYGSPVASYSWVNLDYDEPGYWNKVLVVDSDEELKKYIEGDYTAVDFSTKTLLLVRGKAHSNVMNSTGRSLRYFPSGKYKLEVGLAYTGFMAWGPNWCIPILTDKISGAEKIEVGIIDVSEEKIETI